MPVSLAESMYLSEARILYRLPEHCPLTGDGAGYCALLNDRESVMLVERHVLLILGYQAARETLFVNSGENWLQESTGVPSPVEFGLDPDECKVLVAKWREAPVHRHRVLGEAHKSPHL